MKYYALLKYYLLRIKNDDLNKFHKDQTYLDSIISSGFDEILCSKVIKPIKNKNDIKDKRKRSKNRKKKADEKNEETPEYKIETALNYAIERLSIKLYGLIVPVSGDFLPDFFDMIKLMTLKM